MGNERNPNYVRARQYFLAMDERCQVWESLGIRWVLHHIDSSWQHDDPERYEQWNIEDLLPMTVAAHGAVHGYKERNPNYGKHHKFSSAARKHMSDAHKGKPSGFSGKHFSDAVRQKMSESRRGENNPMFGNHCFSGENNPMYGKHYHWYNDGNVQVLTAECPEGFVPGMLKRRRITK